MPPPSRDDTLPSISTIRKSSELAPTDPSDTAGCTDGPEALWARPGIADALFARNPVPMAVTDVATGRFVDVNAAFVTFLGYARGELIGRTSMDLNLYPPADRERIVEALRTRGRVRNVPVSVHTAHGERRVLVGVDTIAAGGDAAEGNAGRSSARPGAQMLTTLEDVTRLRAAEESGQARAAMTETAFENAPIGKALVSLDGSFLRANRMLCRILGRSEAEILSSTFQDLTHPDDLDADVTLLREVVAGVRESYTLEKRYLRPGGEVVRAQLDVSLVRTPDGAPAYFVSQVQDITALRRATDALAEREATLQRIYETSPVLMGVVDLLDDDIVHVSDNPATAAFFGAPAEAIVGRRSHADLGTHIETLAVWLRAYREAVRTQAPVRFSHLHTHGTRTGHLDITVAPIGVSPEGHPRLSYVAVDLTTERAREAELVDAREAALAADRAKSEFLAVMSHEIRTPLNSVLGFGELLLGTPLLREQREMLELVNESGAHLLRLINDILDLSKIESGGVELEARPFNLRTLLSAVAHTFRPRAVAKGIDLVTVPSPELPALLLGDELRLRQVLANYIGNAVKFTDAGRITVEARSEPDTNSGYLRLHIVVSDTGIGIPPDRMDRLFKTFSQVDASTTRTYGGTGLGLAIVRRLADLMGGAAWAESVPGEGSAFHFTARLRLLRALEVPASTHPEPPRLRPSLRILIAEDVASNQRLLHAILRQMGLIADVAEDGAQAVGAVRAAYDAGVPYDIVLMDVQMPVMDGLQATRAIRAALPATHQPRIIAATADALVGDRERCLRAGMDDFISKPISPRLFADVLARSAT